MPTNNQKSNCVLKCVDVGKSYGALMVLKKVNFGLFGGEKAGLVGANGAGKSTLLKIIYGVLEADKGHLEIAKGTKIKYFPQEFDLEKTVQEYLTDNESLNENTFKDLCRFGFSEEWLGRKFKELSGGEKSKIAMVNIINSPADVFLLDEPTNNLDMDALLFLENFIVKSNKAFLIISHDRKFLDRIVGKIIEIDEFTRESSIYDGGYSDFLEARRMKVEKEWAKYNDELEKRGKIESAAGRKMVMSVKVDQTIANKGKIKKRQKDTPDNTLLRARAGKTARQARILVDRIEKNKLDEIEPPKSRLPLKLNFGEAKQSGDKVFELKEVVKKIGDAKIGPISFSARYGERILIAGANGAGKTTLVKMLLGQTKSDSGELEIGSRVMIGYLPQESEIKNTMTVLEFFLERTKMDEGIGRRLLNRFNLTEEDVHKKIGDISPGARSRLVLSVMMAREANCLILDEPSNHLDLEALENLERALVDFKGTLIVVSHDRYFIEKIGIDKNYLLEGGVLQTSFE